MKPNPITLSLTAITLAILNLVLITNHKSPITHIALAQTAIALPQQSDWVSQGVAIREGADGQWDRYLWGGFANNLIKKGSTYYLYYQGSLTYDDTCDSVAYRAIGVATSTDSINWTKYSGNPVITWASKGSIEEGAASAGVWLGSDGKIHVYYGANTGTGCNVAANGRLAVSTDGFNFTDQGQVINSKDTNLWGSGDEVFPIGVYESGGTWNVFYTPNGVRESRKLGVVSGNSPTTLSTSSAINNGTVPAWGTVSTVLNGTQSLLFVNGDQATDPPLSVYKFSASNPASMTFDTQYSFSDCARASVLYESTTNRWLMLCRDTAGSTTYLVKTAGTSVTPVFSPTPTTAFVQGDINEDGVVNILDFTLLSNAFGTNDTTADINSDGIVNVLDFTILSNNFGKTA